MGKLAELVTIPTSPAVLEILCPNPSPNPKPKKGFSNRALDSQPKG